MTQLVLPGLVLLGGVAGAVGCGGSGGGGGGGLLAAGVSSRTRSGTGTGTGTGGVAPGTVRTPGTGRAPTPKAPPSGFWLKGDMHVHSNHSHDAVSMGDDIATLIKLAERAGLDWTSITDHRNVDCLTDPQFTGAQTSLVLVAGEEWGGTGHASAHGVTRDPIAHTQDKSQGAAHCVQQIEATIADIHSMGGLFVLCHPIDDRNPWLWPVNGFDGTEVWNQSWAFRTTAEMDQTIAQDWMKNAGMNVAGAPQPHPEMLAAIAHRGAGANGQRLKLYEEYLSSGRHIAAIGGSDTHYLALPGNPTTVVFAAKRDQASILDGVRGGHTMVQRAADAPVLEFTADADGDGVFESIVGDSIPLGRAVKFKVHVKGAALGKAVVKRNGQVFQTIQIPTADHEVTFTDAPSSRTWYTVNVYEKLDMAFTNAPMFKAACLGSSHMSWLTTLASGGGLLGNLFGGKLAGWAGKVQELVDAGGPAALWLLLFGFQNGVQFCPIPCKYPRLEWPTVLSKVMNVAVDDDDFCMSVVTSPIWVE